jgi:TPP-dependent trihydroxycyclohexane-1,2-dione (THcHDO) dehydratase
MSATRRLTMAQALVGFLRQYRDRLPYHMARNEQSVVHIASGYAKHGNRPVSRFWDRINRPDQLPGSLLEAMRVLTDPAEYVTIGGAWWDVAVAQVSTSEPVQKARADQRPYL